jgi:uncharacterized membrane protein (DUF106 family)
MDKDDAARIATLLEQIRDHQTEQLTRQREALELQKTQFELVKRQAERAERIQDRAEELQAKSAGIVKAARRSIAFILPIVVLLVVYLSWLIFR